MIYQEKWFKIKEWWLTLALRERKIITIGSCVAMILIVYAGIWSPWLNHIAFMRERVKTNQQVLSWMQSADQEIQKINKQTDHKIISPIILLTLLQKQMSQFGLEKNLTQLKQATNETIDMHFQKVEFDQLIRLLLFVTKQYAVSISQVTAIAEGTPGLVNADVVLKF
ncbi:MAG: hypothetical protein A3F42_07025 [Gammaproteobacteria bacterium RIFCSPHIGHO2_12_FULL_37_34]|nr:MAG: hypothetical protein A3F42_07025 [Gammaproteobacteria bacterium RIFCSPHIGHO2_12_FULL_37_34]